MVAQAFEHGRFACAHLACQNDKSFAALHSINETREGLLVLCAAIQKGGVRTQMNGVLFNA